MTNKQKLSDPDPLWAAVRESDLAPGMEHFTPEECLDIYGVASPSERRHIEPLVRRKIAQTSAEDWPEHVRQQIERHFGINLLSAPGSVDGEQREKGDD